MPKEKFFKLGDEIYSPMQGSETLIIIDIAPEQNPSFTNPPGEYIWAVKKTNSNGLIKLRPDECFFVNTDIAFLRKELQDAKEKLKVMEEKSWIKKIFSK